MCTCLYNFSFQTKRGTKTGSMSKTITTVKKEREKREREEKRRKVIEKKKEGEREKDRGKGKGWRPESRAETVEANPVVPIIITNAKRVSRTVCACSVVSDSALHGLQPPRLLWPWVFPGKNTRVGYHAILQGILLTQGSIEPASPASPTLTSGFFATESPGKPK